MYFRGSLFNIIHSECQSHNASLIYKKIIFWLGMNKILLYGKHSAASALNNQERKCYNLFITHNNATQFLELAKKRGVNVKITEKNSLDKMTNNAVHQGVALECETIFKPFSGIAKDRKADQIVIFDQITDIQNIGAIIRSACAFDTSMIIMPKNHSPKESGAMAKASVGTIDKVEIREATNLVQTIEQLKKVGYWVIALDANQGKDFYEVPLPEKCAFVFGSEDKGIRPLVRKSCDLAIRIPMSKNAESLNVSCAASITLQHFYQQHLMCS